MKVSHTIIAVVILAALGGVFYYLEQQPAAPSAVEAAKQKVFSFAADQVEEFTIEALNQPAVTVRRAAAAGEPAAAPPAGGAPWAIVAPAEIASDTSEIESFINEIPNLQSTPVEGDTPLAASEYGLDAPQKTFRFKLRDGQTVALLLGNQNITGTSKYGKLDSSPNVFLIETASATVLDKTLFNLRDKRAIPVAVDAARQIEVEFNYKDGAQAGTGRLVLAKQQDGNWHLTEPAVRTDFGSSNYFVTSLSGAVMSSVAEEAPAAIARFGLDRPAIRLTVRSADGAATNLWIGNKAGEEAAYYAQNSVRPPVFTLSQSSGGSCIRNELFERVSLQVQTVPMRIRGDRFVQRWSGLIVQKEFFWELLRFLRLLCDGSLHRQVSSRPLRLHSLVFAMLHGYSLPFFLVLRGFAWDCCFIPWKNCAFNFSRHSAAGKGILGGARETWVYNRSPHWHLICRSTKSLADS